MEGDRFDAVVRALSVLRGRRQTLSLLSLLTGISPAFLDATSAKKKHKHKQKKRRGRSDKRRKKRHLAVEGPCGDGSGPDNRCKKDGECCTRHCDKKKGRCRCLKLGQACDSDRLCCPGRTGRTCQEGTCQPGTAACDSACVGCCDEQGACQPGTALDACGSGGAACQVCGDDAICDDGICRPVVSPTTTTTPAPAAARARPARKESR